jgi:hypothetical protein
MSCNVDHAIQVALQRELQAHVNRLNAIVADQLRAWSQAHRMPAPVRIGAAALTAAGVHVASESLRGVLGAILPKPTPAAVEAAQQDYLTKIYKGLLARGVDPIEADRLTAAESCVLHVSNELANGSLIAGALEAVAS